MVPGSGVTDWMAWTWPVWANKRSLSASRSRHSVGAVFSSFPRLMPGRPRAEDNRRAVDEAAALGARVLVLVCGPAPDRDLVSARSAVVEAITDLAGYARTAGLPLAVEPMHPLYCADRSVVVTLSQALCMADAAARASGGTVGVVLDSYHLWWDPELESSVREATGHVLGVQLADWVVPLADALNGRGMLGDGSIDFKNFRRLVVETGYEGLDEIEIFNPVIWERDPAEVLELAAARYEQHVAPGPLGRAASRA